jgi:hypothetical protein
MTYTWNGINNNLYNSPHFGNIYRQAYHARGEAIHQVYRFMTECGIDLETANVSTSAISNFCAEHGIRFDKDGNIVEKEMEYVAAMA